jgi:predicted HTH transcriptional regulator
VIKDMKPEHIELILHGKEERHLEYKGSLDFSTPTTKAMLTRAMAAHTNTRDGGVIVAGMEKSGEVYKRAGINAEHLPTLNTDVLRDYVRAHLTPTPNFTLDVEKYEEKIYAVISVSPFTRYPSVCISSYRDENARKYLLTTGAFYVRSRRKPESVAVETLEDLEDLIDMATDQWLQYRASRDVSSGLGTAEMARKRFEAEGADL